MIKQSLAYFVASGLFLAATALNLFHAGLNLKTGIGLVLFGIPLHLGLKSRRAGD